MNLFESGLFDWHGFLLMREYALPRCYHCNKGLSFFNMILCKKCDQYTSCDHDASSAQWCGPNGNFLWYTGDVAGMYFSCVDDDPDDGSEPCGEV